MAERIKRREVAQVVNLRFQRDQDRKLTTCATSPNRNASSDFLSRVITSALAENQSGDLSLRVFDESKSRLNEFREKGIFRLSEQFGFSLTRRLRHQISVLVGDCHDE